MRLTTTHGWEPFSQLHENQFLQDQMCSDFSFLLKHNKTQMSQKVYCQNYFKNSRIISKFNILSGYFDFPLINQELKREDLMRTGLLIKFGSIVIVLIICTLKSYWSQISLFLLTQLLISVKIVKTNKVLNSLCNNYQIQ